MLPGYLNALNFGVVIMTLTRSVSTVLIVSFLLAFTQSNLAQSSNRLADLSAVTDAQLANPAAEDWLIWRRTYDA